ncbi:MAG: hypothetical protein DSO07_06595 [Thermoproteota archaeon]|uniref:Rhomboid family intramembrane serine protease n=1 Tax=Candidatus Methanodesulfokora washburnensis TaxID=2478471 RepID=A0A520KJA2_9CREN|nr:MAG: rhomboid family intramembrane serine protease [Candidatus Methanodesulfokores washburnensis]TDA41046.1 MAG: hypothetical protein DSO07_06595 [Candidatus Korarchaeota archaeon]
MGLPIPGGEFREFRTPATTWLILINTIVYLLTSYENFFISISDRWVGAGAFIPAMITRPDQAYRLITSMFLHANLVHIFFNMLFLYNFGKPVEAAMGSSRYLILYFLSGFLSEVFHTAFVPIEGAFSALIPALGASGAISGILGAYLLMFPGTRLRMCFLLLLLSPLLYDEICCLPYILVCTSDIPRIYGRKRWCSSLCACRRFHRRSGAAPVVCI